MSDLPAHIERTLNIVDMGGTLHSDEVDALRAILEKAWVVVQHEPDYDAANTGSVEDRRCVYCYSHDGDHDEDCPHRRLKEAMTNE